MLYVHKYMYLLGIVTPAFPFIIGCGSLLFKL